MLDLILLPFRLAFELIGAAFDIFFGLIDLVFGLVGGMVSLAMGIAVLALIIGLLTWFFLGQKKPDDEEEFTSFYHQE